MLFRSRCAGLSLSRPLLLWSTGSAIVAHGPSRSTACGIFPDQDSNPCPLHWQADSQPLRHQGSPGKFLITVSISLLVIGLFIFSISSWFSLGSLCILVAQWIRICLLMQGTRVRSLVWEDPTCRRATKPMRDRKSVV